MRDEKWLIKSPTFTQRLSPEDSNCPSKTVSVKVIMSSCHNGLGNVWTQWNLFVFHVVGLGTTVALPLHTVTQGPGAFRQVASLSAPEACWPSTFSWQWAQNNGPQDQQTYQEGRGGAMHGWSHLLPILSHRAREAHKCRTVWTPCLWKPGTAHSPSVPVSVPPTPPTFFRKNTQREKQKVPHTNQQSTSKVYEKRHCSFISEESLLAVQAHFLPSLSS